MDTTSIQNLLTNLAADYGLSVLEIVSSIIGIGVAYLLFRYAWYSLKRSLFSDSSTSAGNAYLRDERRREALDMEFALSKNYRKNMLSAGMSEEQIAMGRGRALNRRDGLSL